MKRIPAILLLLSAFAVAPPKAVAKDDLPADHPLLLQLASSEVTRGREHRALLVYPIVSEKEDPAGIEVAMTGTAAAEGGWLGVKEPKKKTDDLDLFDFGTKPILLLAGEVLEGGKIDRFLTRDVLLAPGSKALAPAHPAAPKPRDGDEEKKELRPVGALSPDVTRLVGIVDGPTRETLRLLDDLLKLSGVVDETTGLPELYRQEELAERSKEYQEIFSAIPDEGQGRVRGVAVFVGDRFVGIDLFGSNAELRASWPTLLSTHSWQAALYEKAYGQLKQPFPVRDPDRSKARVRELLRAVFAARAEEKEAIGEGSELLLSGKDTVGRALLIGEGDEMRLVHAVLLLDYLTGSPDLPPPPGSAPETTHGEMERREERGGRLTEYEKRLLERQRERRKPTPPIERPEADR